MIVPIYERKAEQQGAPDAYQTNTGVAEYKAPQTQAGDFLSNDTQAFVNAGASAAHAVSTAAAHLYAQQLNEANQTRFKDGYTQYQRAVQQRMYGDNGALNQRGADAFQPKEGKSLLDNVGTDLSEVRSKIAETFSNDQQRQWFNEHADALDAHTQGQLLQHGAEQHRVYQRSTLDTSDAVESDNISLAYNDHNAIQKSLDTINQNGLSRAQLEGLPEETGKLAAKKNTSAALNTAIESALAQGDHASATAILHKFSPNMDTNDMLKNYAMITKETAARASFGVAQNVMSSIYPKMQTSDGDRALNILFNAESGNQHFVPGTQNPVTSHKGAIGIAQVMPGTGPEAAKLAGLPWDESRFRNDPDYNKALGSAYFNQQIKEFHGDLGMAYAAYNAGPGATKDAIEQAGKDGGDWLANLPKETQLYVTSNLKAYATGAGQYQRPTLADAHAAVLEQIGVNAPPDLRKQALAEVTSQYEEQTKAIKQRSEESTAEAMRQLLQNGGKFSALPVNIRSAVPPDQMDNLMNFGKKVSEGEPITTDWGLYYQLKTDTALLNKTNLMAVRDKLSDTEFKQLSGEQKTAASGEELTQTRTAKEVLNGYMREVGIDPTPKDGDAKGAAQVGKIWASFEQHLSDAERLNGKKLTTEEISKVAAQLFTKVGVKGVLYGTNEKPKALLNATDQIKVPDADRAQIIKALRLARPGLAITEDDIFNLYAKHKGLN